MEPSSLALTDSQPLDHQGSLQEMEFLWLESPNCGTWCDSPHKFKIAGQSRAAVTHPPLAPYLIDSFIAEWNQ